MKSFTKKIVSFITAAAFTASLSVTIPSPVVDAQNIHWQHGEFYGWNDPADLPSSGSYVLECDVTLYHPIIVADNLDICLNGHNIVFKIAPNKDYPDENTYGFFLTEDADLNIYAEESGGKVVTLISKEGDSPAENPSETTADLEETEIPDITEPDEPDEITEADETTAEPTETTEPDGTSEAEESSDVSSDTAAEEATESSEVTKTAEETEEASAGENTEETVAFEENQPEETSEAAETANVGEDGEPTETETSSKQSEEAVTGQSEGNNAEAVGEEGQIDDSSNSQILALYNRSFRPLFKSASEVDTDSDSGLGTTAATEYIPEDEDGSETDIEKVTEDGSETETNNVTENSSETETENVTETEPENVYEDVSGADTENDAEEGSETETKATENQPVDWAEDNLGESGDEIVSNPILISHQSTGTLSLYGGVLETEGSVCIIGGENSAVNIYGGGIKAHDNSAKAVSIKGDLKVNDGVISGGIEFEGNRLVISGGRVINGVNIIDGSAVISGGLITGKNAVQAVSDENTEITVCDNAVLTGDTSALNILNENARVYLYGEPVIEGNVCLVPSENPILYACSKDDPQKIYTGEAISLILPKNGGGIFDGSFDGKPIVSGVNEENASKFIISQEYYELEQQDGALMLKATLVKITDIYLEDAAAEVGGEIVLVPVIAPEDYFEKIIWSSSDPEIASVDESGKVTAHRVGSVTVTAAAHTDADIFASCTVEVTSSKVYNITYDTMGVNASISEKYKHYVYGTVTTLPTPAAVGYSFVGWHKSPDLEDEIVTEIGALESGDITLYAEWSTDSFSLEFVLNGGEFGENVDVPDSYAYGTEDVLPVPTRESFKFMGWYETEDFSDTAVYKIPVGAVEDKVYYAKWVANNAAQYSVIFRVNDDIAVVIVYEGEIPKYPKGTPAKSSDERYDYEFAGWSPEIVPADDFAEYEAVFNAIPKSFNVTLNLDGGVTDEQLNSYIYGNAVILPVPEKEGFNFQGWYTDSEFSGESVLEITAEDMGDKTYFAKWEEITEENGEKDPPKEVEISDEVIDIVWPANAKVILNPYKMKIANSSAERSGEIIYNDVNGITDTIISPELKFINKSSSEVKVIVSGSVRDVASAVDSEGVTFTYEGTNIDFATEPINKSENGGDRNNTILLYLEKAYDIDSAGTGYYTNTFDADNPLQMLLGRETVTREFFTIPASENEDGARANVKICGDMSVNPILSWDKLAKTDTVDINLVFTAVPSVENQENPEENKADEEENADKPKQDSPDDENQGAENAENNDKPVQGSSDDDNQSAEDVENTDKPVQDCSDDESKKSEQADDGAGGGSNDVAFKENEAAEKEDTELNNDSL